ncbi:tripartite motif-containing protein 10-like isoform X2 [Chrysemys picta bellii]
MEKAVSDCLHDILEELTKDELKKFKLKLNKFKLKRDYDNIPMGKLEDASPVDMTQSLLSYYGEDYGAEVTVDVLKSINRRDLAEKLSETLRPDGLTPVPEPQQSPKPGDKDRPKGRENENPERATATASETPEWEVKDEATCPICLDYFSDPVTVDCGHSSCEICITTYCEKSEEGNHGCPICRSKMEKVNFRPNWQLASLVEKVKCRLKPGKEEKENLCERHKEKLSLFCEDDGEFICVECDKSALHKAHTVVLIKEAVQKYKGQICVHLNNLNKKKEELLGIKLNEERQSQKHQEETESVRKKIMSEFEELEKILQEQRQPLLAQLEELNKDIVKRENENVTKLFKEISFLSNLIKELKEKWQQPASEFLQDIRSTLNRYVAHSQHPPRAILHYAGRGLETMLKWHLLSA